MIDLNKIQNEEDKILINDAIKLADSGFLRASYIMSFLACIESLKRRFIELGKKDSSIGRINTEIKNKEERHESVEKFVITKAKELMLIDDIEKSKLEYFWGMRSVYSHPYEQNPSYLDCQHIINSIYETVPPLSQALCSWLMDSFDQSQLNAPKLDSNSFCFEKNN